jgi:3-deoxy-D-manno-octulosonic-acid transferase
MGFLCALYRCADAAVVGGTWARIGGHNLFEPAREGVAVFFGGSIGEVGDVAETLQATRGGCQVRDAAALAKELGRLCDDRPACRAMGEAAAEAARRLGGAVGRTLTGLSEHGIPPEGGE